MAKLAKPGDPLIIGTDVVVMDDSNGKFDTVSVEEYNERRKIPDFTKFQPARVLSFDTMPEKDQEKQVVLATIVGLRLMGMDFGDIAEMLNTSNDKIKEMLQNPAAQTTFERIFRGLIGTNAETVQGRIASHADNAVSVVLELMNSSETRDDVRLKASQDILDRSGTNADQFFQESDSNHGQEDDLRIVIMDEEGEKEKVKVEIGRKK